LICINFGLRADLIILLGASTGIEGFSRVLGTAKQTSLFGEVGVFKLAVQRERRRI
jgi:hypothetical protein